MPASIPIPSLKQLDSAPQRSILYALNACARCAQQTIQFEHPRLGDFDSPDEDDLFPVRPPIVAAANSVLGRISELLQAIAIYDALLAAARQESSNDLPF